MSKPKTPDELIPQLRFPEFRDADAWSFRPLHALGSRVTERNSDESITRVLTNSAEHGVLDQRDFFEKDIAVAGRLDNYFVIEEGDYVYNPRISRTAPMGPISRNNVGRGVMSPLYTVFRLGEGGTDFHEHYFATNGWHNYLRSVSSTGARHDRMSIGIGDFMEMPIPLPSPAEQRKIAECLGSLDDLIAAETDALAALRRHKTGLTQQLFPRPGETRPRLRFSEFHNDRDWKATRLDPHVTLISGVHLAPDAYAEEGEAPYFTGPTDFTNDVSSVRKWAGASPASARADDTLITVKGSGVGQLWYLELESVVIGRQLMAARMKAGSSLFLFYLLDTQRRRLEDLSLGNLIPGLSRGDILTLEVAIPDPAEQHRIADCLASLDGCIAAQEDKLAALRAHKSGLMQQLFPAPGGRAGGVP